jgi:hypothetical protein
VVPEEDVSVGRHVIDAILELVRRRHELGIESIDPARDVARADPISGEKRRQTDDEQGDCTHGPPQGARVSEERSRG